VLSGGLGVDCDILFVLANGLGLVSAVLLGGRDGADRCSRSLMGVYLTIHDAGAIGFHYYETVKTSSSAAQWLKIEDVRRDYRLADGGSDRLGTASWLYCDYGAVETLSLVL